MRFGELIAISLCHLRRLLRYVLYLVIAYIWHDISKFEASFTDLFIWDYLEGTSILIKKDH